MMVVLLFVLTGCGNDKENLGYNVIDSKGVAEMLKSEGETYLVDVRTEEEYDTSHIELAINLSVDQFEEKFETDITDNKDANIIVYCRSGARSKQAAEILVKLGYKNVYDFGSLGNWPYDLVN